jgi:acyl carrier protein
MEVDMTDYTETIKSFIETEMIGSGSKESISASESLIERGVIDSLGVQVLIGYLEKEFGISVIDYEIVPENFETVKSVASFVNSKLASGN